jgi:Na+-driven multidrug efflux pump
MVAFVLFQTIPDKIILLFGSGDELYMEFACIAFRTYLLCCVLNAVVIPTGIFLQSIGKSLKSGILSLARKIIFLLPSIFILGKIFGLMGLLYAAVVSDILSFITATTLLIIEVKYLKNKKIILTYDVEK